MGVRAPVEVVGRLTVTAATSSPSPLDIRCAARHDDYMHNESRPQLTPADLVPSAEVCAELNITPSTLSRWVASGRIAPALKAPGLRGAMFFTRAAVDAAKAAA